MSELFDSEALKQFHIYFNSQMPVLTRYTYLLSTIKINFTEKIDISNVISGLSGSGLDVRKCFQIRFLLLKIFLLTHMEDKKMMFASI